MVMDLLAFGFVDTQTHLGAYTIGEDWDCRTHFVARVSC